mmetsp:Transcript_16679/g.29187  ORF Transcript_16679/g.29187 Transcript_16679/m.29187 type:complete len:377 (-) Transcript_16679:100-1230(-)
MPTAKAVFSTAPEGSCPTVSSLASAEAKGGGAKPYFCSSSSGQKGFPQRRWKQRRRLELRESKLTEAYSRTELLRWKWFSQVKTPDVRLCQISLQAEKSRHPRAQSVAMRYWRPKPSRSRSCGPTWQVPLKADFDKVAADAGPKKEAVGKTSSKQVVIRKARALLNKISTDNETVIIAQLAALSHETEASKTIAILLVETATRNPFQSEVYVEAICQLMRKSTSIAFRDGVREEIERLYKSFFEGQCWDEELQNRAQALLRLLGNLFLADRVSVDVLWQCIARLLRIEDDEEGDMKPPPEAWIECCLELLDTIGQELGRSSKGIFLQRAALRRLRAWKDFRTPMGDLLLPSKLRFLILNTLEGRAKRCSAYCAADI